MINQALNLWYTDCVLLAGHPEPFLNMGLPLLRLSPHLETETLPYVPAPEHGWEEAISVTSTTLSLHQPEDVPILWQAGHRRVETGTVSVPSGTQVLKNLGVPRAIASSPGRFRKYIGLVMLNVFL